MKTVAYFKTHNDGELECWVHLSPGMCKVTTDKQQHVMDKNVASVFRLPKYWKAQSFATLDSSDDPMTQTEFEAFDAFGRDLVQNLFYMHMLVPTYALVPAELRSDSGFCSLVHKLLGMKLGGIHAVNTRFFSQGNFDPMKETCYKSTWSDERKTTHVTWCGVPTASRPVDVPTKRSFVLQDPFGLLKAMAKNNGAAKYYLRKFWPEGVGPWPTRQSAKRLKPRWPMSAKPTWALPSL